VHDVVTGATYDWGAHNYVRLDPFDQPAHVFTVRRSSPARGPLHDDRRLRARRAGLPRGVARPAVVQARGLLRGLIRGFKDSKATAPATSAGLTSKLDYLQWLGVDCVWLLPIYESPLRDGGYDISDFMKVLPEFGDLGDFVELVDEAHKRGMRIIADLVMNHSSDQHPWFQASRSTPRAVRRLLRLDRHDEPYSEARIIFVDTETSNWTWDPVRKQYYWHRFFSHQPDLNYENPAVQEAMIDVLKFWLDLGIDGFRLDAVPYLFEELGHNGENHPKTHEYLKRVRKEVDALYPDRVMLCEANQWPEDVVEYFGEDGDECQMAFHFPLMPRLFMAVAASRATRSRRSWRTRRRSRTAASGASSCATTTS
jgi:maltose alpha-D-glucosyltransferase/alpha-amylase